MGSVPLGKVPSLEQCILTTLQFNFLSRSGSASYAAPLTVSTTTLNFLFFISSELRHFKFRTFSICSIIALL